MIAYIKGKVKLKADDFIILELDNFGYKVHLSSKILKPLKEGQTLELFIHHHITSESQGLYGFLTQDEWEFFQQMIAISGIGPKSAMGVLNLAPVTTIKKAIISDDASFLTKVSGIGRKTAERIIVELKDKIEETQELKKIQLDSESIDVLEALMGLGYTRLEAREAIKKLPEGLKGVENKIKEALRLMGQK